MEKTKYNRLASDASQLQQFGEEVIDAINNSPTKEELEEAVRDCAKVWNIPDFIENGSFADLPTGIKKGDIFIDNQFFFVGIVTNINYENYKLSLDGINDGTEPTHISLEGDLWQVSVFESGTKLYKHTLIDTALEYTFILITDSAEPLDFTELDSYRKVFAYLETINVISFKYIGTDIQWADYQGKFFYVNLDNNVLSEGVLDDWALSSTTDTVAPL